MEQKLNKKSTTSTLAHNKFIPEDIKSSDNNSIQYFSNLRWNGIRTCPRCGYSILYYLKPNRYACKKCSYKFDDFTGTYLGKLKIKPSLIKKLLSLFASDQTANKCIPNAKCNKSTIERTFRLFRQAIYDKSLQHIQQKLKIFKEIGIDEGILNTDRRAEHYLEYKKDIDGKEYLIFAIYKMNRFVVAFPVSYIETDILDSLKNEFKKKKSTDSEIEDNVSYIFKQIEKNEEFNHFNIHGSFYKKNDHIAYAMLDIDKRKVVAYNDVFGETEGIYIGLEGFWSYVEKRLYHYRRIPKQYFHLYLKEIEFRFNLRFNYYVMFSELSKLLVKPFPTNR